MMALPVHSRSVESEKEFLDRLRDSYERRGFNFFANPKGEEIPDFLQGIYPDAIAKKPGESIIVEIKDSYSDRSEKRFAELRRRIEQHPGWRLDLVFRRRQFAEISPISPVTAAEVIRISTEVEKLNDAGHSRAALLLAWSLLEATLNSIQQEKVNHIYNPRQVVQKLAMEGYLDLDMEKSLLASADLRNRAAHGDFQTEVNRSAVETVIRAARIIADVGKETMHGA